MFKVLLAQEDQCFNFLIISQSHLTLGPHLNMIGSFLKTNFSNIRTEQEVSKAEFSGIFVMATDHLLIPFLSLNSQNWASILLVIKQRGCSV